MRKPFVWPVVAVMVALLAALVLVMRYSSGASKTVTLRTGNHSFRLEVAQTEAAQELGLGGRQSLDEGQGMLFRYPDERQLCFWMKDMHFPIDMIWTGSDKRVQHIEAEVSPQTYPKAFCGAGLARYVIELKAGAAAQSGLKTGSQLQF